MRKTLALLLACTLSVLAGSTIGAGTASADVGHVVTIDDATAVEGSGNALGTASVTVHVAPAPEAGEQVTVDFGTSDEPASGATATSTSTGSPAPAFPNDFVHAQGTLIFTEGETSESISVPVVADNADEADEKIVVNIFN